MNQHRQEQEDYEDDEDLDDEDQQEEEMDDEDEAQQDPRAAREQQGAAASANVAANVPQLEGYDRAELIGQGAYGMVFRGRRRESQEVCAIKHIAFGENNMEGGVPCAVIREISLLRELDHPNVVRLIDVIQAQPGGLYLVFEFVDYDLKKYMDAQQVSEDPMQRRGLGPAVVKKFLRQILEGVRFCHTYRVLHRDLKPHNLLISADGQRLKLADFGLARLSALPAGQYTHEVVTLWYRAPELLLGATRYSASVDVWSIGCIMAEMATGYALFPGRSDIDQIFKIFQRRGTPSTHSGLWPGVEQLPHFNAEFPQWSARSIADFVSLETFGNDQNAIDLLERFLQYDPDTRIGCRRALEHPYFSTA